MHVEPRKDVVTRKINFNYIIDVTYKRLHIPCFLEKANAIKLHQTLDCVKVTEMIMSFPGSAHGGGVCKIHEENYILNLVSLIVIKYFCIFIFDSSYILKQL